MKGERSTPRHEALAAVARARGGADASELTRSLDALVQLDLESGDIASAVESAHELVDLLERLLPDDDRSPADWAAQFGSKLEQRGASIEAEQQYLRAIRRFELVGSGKNAAALRNNIGLMRYRQGDFAEAAEALEGAVEAYSALGNGYELNVIRALGSLAEVHKKSGVEPERARALARLASIVEPLGWPTLPKLLTDLTEAYLDASDPANALLTSEKLVAIGKREFGERDARVAAARVSRAVVLRALARESEAEQELRAALETLAREAGPVSSAARAAASNLAALLRDQGKYSEAVSLLEGVVTGARTDPNITPAELETLLTNYAEILRLTGEVPGAVNFFEEALQVGIQAYGEADSRLVRNVVNLAIALKDAGRREESFQRLETLMQLDPDRPGVQSPLFLGALLNAAGVATELGDYVQAERWLVFADATAYRTVGSRHPKMAEIKAELAAIALRRWKPALTRSAAQSALRILDETRPGANPTRARALQLSAEACAMLGLHDEALRNAAEAERTYDAMLGQVFATAPDRQRTAFAARVRDGFESFLSVLLAANWTRERARLGLVTALRRKGLSVDAFAVQREAALGRKYPQLADKLQQLREQRWQSAVRLLAGDGDVAPTANLDALEIELARAIPEMNIERRLREVDVAPVAAALRPGAALVEIVRATVTSLIPSLEQRTLLRSDRYLAFVVAASAPDDVALVDLGDALVLDSLAERFRGAIAPERGTRDLVGELGPEPLDVGLDALEQLGRLLWGPLASHLTDYSALTIAPDGALSLLPFEALPDSDGRPLLERYEISYALCGRDLLRFTEPSPAAAPPCVLGAPDYGRAESGEPGPFLDLPGARMEVTEVARQLAVEPMVGEDATKQRLLAARSPSVLHLATHGFALPFEPSQGDDASLRSLLGAQHSPMLRAGLALAGANAGSVGAQNGIITAYEIAELDLHGTTLAVLSACETGAGLPVAQEGVYGLRRALVIAGARTQIVSLWPVPDRATQSLMNDFYGALARGAGCAAALREAKLTAYRQGQPTQAWAGFICLGNPHSKTDTRHHTEKDLP